MFPRRPRRKRKRIPCFPVAAGADGGTFVEHVATSKAGPTLSPAAALPISEILDFKTDSIEAADAASLTARTEYYRPQIAAYRSVVREQYGLAENDVSGKLVFLGAGVVREVVPGGRSHS